MVGETTVRTHLSSILQSCRWSVAPRGRFTPSVRATPRSRTPAFPTERGVIIDNLGNRLCRPCSAQPSRGLCESTGVDYRSPADRDERKSPFTAALLAATLPTKAAMEDQWSLEPEATGDGIRIGTEQAWTYKSVGSVTVEQLKLARDDARGSGLGDALQSSPEAGFLGDECGAIDALVAGSLQSIDIEYLGMHLGKQCQENA